MPRPSVSRRPQERQNHSLNIRQLSIKMHGSEKFLVLKEKFMAEVGSDILPTPLLLSSNITSLTQLEDRATSRVQAVRHP